TRKRKVISFFTTLAAASPIYVERRDSQFCAHDFKPVKDIAVAPTGMQQHNSRDFLTCFNVFGDAKIAIDRPAILGFERNFLDRSDGFQPSADPIADYFFDWPFIARVSWKKSNLFSVDTLIPGQELDALLVGIVVSPDGKHRRAHSHVFINL